MQKTILINYLRNSRCNSLKSPSPNLTLIFSKVNFLKNATEQGHKTARRLLSSYLFDLSNLSEHINDAMTKIQKSTTILGIIFDKYDTTGAEDP
ncbi:MAG: hypothetical protein MHMPM18_004394 [Marteilia pararefringens]